MIESNCVLCGELVYASPKPETWGIDWITGYVHYRCAGDLFDAIKRMENVNGYSEVSGEILKIDPDQKYIIILGEEENADNALRVVHKWLSDDDIQFLILKHGNKVIIVDSDLEPEIRQSDDSNDIPPLPEPPDPSVQIDESTKEKYGL